MPRVSILLTCYNHLPHLKVAMECIKSQTFKDYEIHALDDGSTDGTREWLERLKQESPELPLSLNFNESNLGTYGTLNRGIDVSSGEFIAVFNDDDVWAPTKLAAQLAKMGSNPRIGLVHTSGWFIDHQGARLESNPLGFDWPMTLVEHSPACDALHELALYNRIIASSVLVRRECFDKVGVFDSSYFGSGDWEMWFRIAERFEIGHIDEPLTLYRVHAGSASHFKPKIAQDDLKIREWMLSRLIAQHQARWDAGSFRRLIAHQWACIGSGRVLAGDARGGRRAFVESLKAMPWRFKSVVRFFVSFLPASAFHALDLRRFS